MNDRDSQDRHRQIKRLLTQAPAPDPPSSELVDTARQQALAAYDLALERQASESPWTRVYRKGAVIVAHPITRWAAACAAVLIVAAWLVRPEQSIAFDALLDPIINAKSAKFRLTVSNDVQKQPITAQAYYLAPSRIRQEIALPDEQMVSIADMREGGRMVSLMSGKKEAIVFELVGKLPPGKGLDLFGDLQRVLAEYRQSKQGQVEELGEKEIDARKAFGFRISGMGTVQTVWGDKKTGQVIRIESTFRGPPRTETVMSDFEFDIPLDQSLFDTDPPEGYSVTTVPMNVTPPTEEDFVEAMRRLSDVSDGKFPENLDTPGISSAMVRLIKDKETEAAMTEGAAIGRGLMFANMLPDDADAHYAGKGVTRDGPKQPVLWYRPEGGKSYRVVWSDLTVSEVDTPPDVPGAIRLVEKLKGTKE